ncbi:glycosyltransferase [Candidatus Saccharibacteria bacterium]|nr:glycosyltransferase [Candidatus Saccharibacteria bacterium]
MKIAFFSDCYLDLTGGIVSSINAQKAALEKNGHTVYIFSSGYPRSRVELQKIAKNHIYQVPSCKYCFKPLTPVSRRPKIIEDWLIKTHPELKDFDVFYIHYESGCSIAGLRLGKKLHIPTVQVMHGREDMGEAGLIPFGFRTIVAASLNWFHSWYLPHKTTVHRDEYYADTFAKAKMWTMMVNHANSADLVLTPSEHFRKKLIHYGVAKDIVAFPNGYPDEKYPSSPTVKQLQPDEELKMIWHSRVSAEKRIIPFLQALTNVRGKYRLEVYGGGGDLKRAKRFVDKHHLNVHFHGDTPFTEVQKVIMDSHLDILVSYNYDTFGMTLIEAEAAGIPVFFCDPDMEEVVPPDSFIISKNESPQEMAKALNKIFKHPEMIEQMSKVMLENRHDVLISHRIKALEKIFNGIIKK